MSIRETDVDNIKTGSSWKYLNSTRLSPDDAAAERVYTVGGSSRAGISFGSAPTYTNQYTYSTKEFLRDLVPYPENKGLFTEVLTLLAQVKSCPELMLELEKLLTDLEI